MTLSLYQVSFNGLTLGPGTAYDHISLGGFRGLPPVNIADPLRPRNDGGIPGASYLGPRVITLTVNLFQKNPSTMETAYQALAAAFTNINNPDHLTQLLAMLSSSWSNARGCLCRPSRAPLVIDKQVELGFYTSIVLELTAPDPLIYDSVVQSITGTGGGPFSSVCVNAGNTPVRPIITASHVGSGVVTQDGDTALSWSGVSMGATSPWVIDCQARTVTDSNGANRNGDLDVAPNFPILKPGSTTIALSGGYGVGAALNVSFSSGWSFA